MTDAQFVRDVRSSQRRLRIHARNVVQVIRDVLPVQGEQWSFEARFDQGPRIVARRLLRPCRHLANLLEKLLPSAADERSAKNGTKDLAVAISGISITFTTILAHYGWHRKNLVGFCLPTVKDCNSLPHRRPKPIKAARLTTFLSSVQVVGKILEQFDPNPLLSSHLAALNQQIACASPDNERPVPDWHSVDGRLTFLNSLCKQFSRQQGAKNQRAVLDVFEEEGWPDRVDSPFPRGTDKLKETLKALRKGLKHITFRSESGVTIVWKPSA